MPEFDLYSLDTEDGKRLIERLKSDNTIRDQVLASLADGDEIDLRGLSDGAGRVLASILDESCLARMGTIPQGKLDLESLGDGAGWLLQELVRSERGSEIIHRIPDDFELHRLCDNAVWLLETALHLGNEELVGRCQRLLSEVESDGSMRQGYEAESFSIKEKKGPYLHELVDGLPIEEGSLVELKQGWSRARLDKTGPATYVYVNLDREPPCIAFRNDGIPIESLEAYEKARDVVPDFIASSTYPELKTDSPDRRMYPEGFRSLCGSDFKNVGFR